MADTSAPFNRSPRAFACAAITELGVRCGRDAREIIGPVPLCWQHASALEAEIRHRLDGRLLDPLRDHRIEIEERIAEAKADLDRLSHKRSRMRKEVAALKKWIIQRQPIARARRRRVIDRDDRRCLYCFGRGTATAGPDGEPWHIDHLTPVSRGGGNELENLALACGPCNMDKRDRTFDEYVDLLAQRGAA
jgi:5-methylcytosine-specific restriction endonuclease McrA